MYIYKDHIVYEKFCSRKKKLACPQISKQMMHDIEVPSPSI